MKSMKLLIFLSAMLVSVVLTLIMKNYFFDKGLLALKEEKYEVAMKYLKPIAIAGDGDAQHFVGECYAFGLSVPKNAEKAIYWFRRAAKKNKCAGDECIAADLYFVGDKYLNGIGVEMDKRQAEYWIKKSAESGYPKAIEFLYRSRDAKLN